MLCKPARIAPLKLQSSLAMVCFNLAELETFPGGWGVGVGWLAGSTENKANSAQLELELGLSLAICLRHSKECATLAKYVIGEQG